MLEELFAYNDWANEQIVALSTGLSDEQLDAPKPMGFGSLRRTLFHLVAAEELWQDRMEGQSWAPLATEALGIGLDEFAERFRSVAARRNRMLAQDRADQWQRLVAYTNTEGEPYEHRLVDLLTHVANHAIHHRAQALNMLRDQDRRLPVGLDYLFFKLARPSVAQPPGTLELARNMGLDVAEFPSEPGTFALSQLRRYADYGVWVMDLLYRIAGDLSDAEWNRSFAMGPGSVRASLCHIADAERWWLRNFVSEPGEFQALPDRLSCDEARKAWDTLVTERDTWLDAQTDASLLEVVEGRIGASELRFRRGEMLLQLCGHGTHHRAQIVNMLRQLGKPAPPVDFVVWVRHGSPTPPPLSRALNPRY